MTDLKDNTFVTTIRTLAIALPFALASCASIVSKSDETFAINSVPAGAKFTIADENGVNVYTGMTPLTVTLPKSGGYFNGRDYSILFERDGFSPYTTTVSSRPSGWYLFGNLLFGGLIGWFIVDPATGSMWTFDETEINPALTPLGAGLTSGLQSDQPSVVVMTIDQVPEDQRKHLIPLNPG
ncbi:hypothetical protein [Marinivivus vitaminiproducens]|uniref:hypothetical protein n=1 Tax=Marinivivus vitaminiproducens TaxID=3035935 RepID=UPI00279A201B|nr:hypothetical protein P4R82_09545 [Geminicoccaceae bacterium SCSIO 64248]